MGVVCQIILKETKEGVYRPGQTVEGTVKYFIDKPTKFGSIHIHFIGKGKCEWSEKDSDDKWLYYKNAEEYIKQYRNIFIVRDDNNEISGNFEHPFEFLLPDDLPTALKNNTCTIEYKIILTFVKENLFETKYTFEEEVPVYGYVEPCSPEPLIFGLQKDLFSLTTKKMIDVKAEIEKSFLTPGENITLRLTVNNDSDVPITIKTELMKYFTYIDEGKVTKKIERESVRATKGYSPVLQEKNVSKLTCIVPTLPSCYSIQHSKILIGEYKVRVTVKVPFPHINATVETTVVIGERRDKLGVTAVLAEMEDESPSSSKVTAEDDKNLGSENVENFFDLHKQLKELQFD